MNALRRLALVCALTAIASTCLAGPSAQASPAPPETRAITPGHQSAPKGGTTTVGLGLTRSNTNAQLAESIPATVRPGWAASPPYGSCLNEFGEFEISTTAVSKKYTVVLEHSNCDRVSVYRTSSGKLVWRRAYFKAPQITTKAGYVYVLGVDIEDDYFVEALTVNGGKRRWLAPATNGATDLVAGSGVVVDGSQVLRIRDGHYYFLPYPVALSPNHPQSLVTNGHIIRNTLGEVDAWTPDGRFLWRYTKAVGPSVAGAGETLPQAHGGKLYIRAEYTGHVLVLDAATGAKVGDLPETSTPLAIDGNIGIIVSSEPTGARAEAVSAIDLIDGHVYWSRSFLGTIPELDRHPAVPPVIENGLVWTVTENGDEKSPVLVALDETTGIVRGEVEETCRLQGHRTDRARGTIGIAQHRLFVPGPCGLQTFVAAR